MDCVERVENENRFTSFKFNVSLFSSGGNNIPIDIEKILFLYIFCTEERERKKGALPEKMTMLTLPRVVEWAGGG